MGSADVGLIVGDAGVPGDAGNAKRREVDEELLADLSTAIAASGLLSEKRPVQLGEMIQPPRVALSDVVDDDEQSEQQQTGEVFDRGFSSH